VSGVPGLVVAVLGTGRMGSAIARRLARLGYVLVLWNRTREKAEELASEVGARAVDRPFDAVQEAQAVVLALADDDALYSVLSGFHRLDGALVVNTGTITPQTARRAASFVEGLGGCYVESPIVGGPRAVEAGEATGIVAGRRVCLAQARSLLSDLFKRVVHVGEDPGAAAALKLSFNSLLISTVEALAEALALAEAYGVEKGLLGEVLEGTVFREVANKYLDRVTGPVGGGASFTLDLALKDLEYAARAAYHAGVPVPGVRGSEEAYAFAVREGLGKEDYTRVYRALKPRRA